MSEAKIPMQRRLQFISFFFTVRMVKVGEIMESIVYYEYMFQWKHE